MIHEESTCVLLAVGLGRKQRISTIHQLIMIKTEGGRVPGISKVSRTMLNIAVAIVEWPEGYAGNAGLIPGFLRFVLGAPRGTH